jgi:hypothetical protein
MIDNFVPVELADGGVAGVLIRNENIRVDRYVVVTAVDRTLAEAA